MSYPRPLNVEPLFVYVPIIDDILGFMIQSTTDSQKFKSGNAQLCKLPELRNERWCYLLYIVQLVRRLVICSVPLLHAVVQS
jgi:hypothetical protein